MCGKQELNGADSEPYDRADSTCDYCGQTEWNGPLVQLYFNEKWWWLCGRCVERETGVAA